MSREIVERLAVRFTGVSHVCRFCLNGDYVDGKHLGPGGVQHSSNCPATKVAEQVERLLTDEREKVLEMCVNGIETLLLRPEDSEQLVERIELGIKIRQLDLTAPSKEKG